VTETAAAPEDTPPPPSEEHKPPSRRPKKKGEGKTSKQDLYLDISGAMRRSPASSMHQSAPFPVLFRVIEDVEGCRRPVKITGDNVVSRVHPDAVIEEIDRYVTVGLSNRNLQFASRDCHETYKKWRALAKPLDEQHILPVAELNHEGYTWRRLPFDFKAGPSPYFDGLMERATNHKALMAWIGSLFDAGADRSQYLYIFGQGGTGKGRLASFLSTLMGDAYAAVVAENRNQFWTSQLVGKRLACFADLRNSRFLNEGLFLTLTGEDAIPIEPKGQNSYTTRLKCKFLILSNHRPELEFDAANLRRALLCEMMPLPPGTERIPSRVFDSHLWEEAAFWLDKCRKEWHQHTVTGFIPSDNREEVENVMARAQSIHHDLFERWFDVEESGKVMQSEMMQIMRREKKDDGLALGKWYRFLENSHSIPMNKRESKHPRPYYYPGIKIKTSMRAVLESM
jgi:hypothetical protein